LQPPSSESESWYRFSTLAVCHVLLHPIALSLYRSVIDRDPEALVIVPPRATAILSKSAGTAPTQRGRHPQCIADKGRIGRQKASGYSARSRVEAAIGRYRQVVGNGLRYHKDERRTAEVGVAVYVLSRMLQLGRPISVRIA
jgi:hypothetical protein